jgi:hypothetical protein
VPRSSEQRQPILSLDSATYAFQVRSTRAARPDDTPLMVDLDGEEDAPSDSVEIALDATASDEAPQAVAPSCSRYRSLSRGWAWALLVQLVLTMGWFGWSNFGHHLPSLKPVAKQHRDSELYLSIIERVRAGQPYYDAAGAELRAREFPRRPMFNWRQPTYALVLSHLAEVVADADLGHLDGGDAGADAALAGRRLGTVADAGRRHPARRRAHVRDEPLLLPRGVGRQPHHPRR